MALTGLDIFKLLPKTNCKKCGMPTCLAFAMQLAQKRAELDACPCVSEEAKNKLDAAAAPPVKLIKFQADKIRFR
ncbi:MAG: (Fe-S)-binding protein [Planctomycetota bacterium]|jgi:acetyl-CoA decarbonylase/synthase complex subunit gamma